MKLRKTLALILAGALALSLSACGGGGNNPGGAPSEAPSENAAPTQAPSESVEPTPTPEPEPQFISANIGDTVTLDFVEFTLTDFGHGEKITEGNSSLSWAIDSGCEAFWLHGTLTNTSGAAFDVYNGYVKIIFDDTYAYEGTMRKLGGMEAAPLADSSVYLCADVPPKAFESYEKVTVQLCFNENFTDFDWSKGEKTAENFDYAYEFVQGAGGSANPEGEGQPGGEGNEPAPETGLWYVDHYVDNFNQPDPEKWYITNNEYITGTFSNSATTNSKLLVQMAVDHEEGKHRAAMFLYEYGRNLVKNSSVNYVDEYNITMRTADGTDHEFTGTMYCGGDRIFVDDQYVDEVLTAMQVEGSVSFYIVKADRTTSTYLFTVETSNFASMYQSEAG